MIVFIQLTPVGTNVGPFNLFSDVDGFASPFATAVSSATLLAGANYTITGDPTQIQIASTGVCSNSITLDISTTSTSTTTSTTSSTSSSTTTSTTTVAPADTIFDTFPATDEGGGSNPRTEYWSSSIIGEDVPFIVELTAVQTDVTGGAGQIAISIDPEPDFDSKIWVAMIGFGGTNPYDLAMTGGTPVYFRVIAGSSGGDYVEFTVTITATTVGSVGTPNAIVMTSTN